MNGLGNAYVGFHIGVDREAVNFASNEEATAPTGDKDNGFTGRATVDWNNSFSHNFSSVTPFASIGLANTVSDTSFFVRPFTSLGLVSHFDGGAKFKLSQFVDVGASAYGVRAAGQYALAEKKIHVPGHIDYFHARPESYRPRSQCPSANSGHHDLGQQQVDPLLPLVTDFQRLPGVVHL